MCGLVGAFGRLVPSLNLEAATQALRHRGPDGFRTLATGHALLGHTQLSILDPSEQARQPFRSLDGRLSLVFNGEIFNFRELRRVLAFRGSEFQTTSDAEVLLRLFETEGICGLRKLEGMFAFAIHETNGQVERLLLGR